MMRGFVTLVLIVTEPNPISGVGLKGARISFGATISTGFSLLATFLSGGVTVI